MKNLLFLHFPPIYSFVRSFVRSSVRSFAFLLVCSFLRLFVCSFIYSFVHLFVFKNPTSHRSSPISCGLFISMFPTPYPPCIVLTSFFCVICSVSPVLDCGHTLVGGRKVVQLVCENKGGDGKFCIMRKSHWPTTTFQVWYMKCCSTSTVQL